MIQGFELSYDGVAEQANEGLKYLNPFLSTSRRVFQELAADRLAFENLIVDTSELSGRARRPLARHLGPGRQPRPDDERDRRPKARAREGDQPAARLHAQREHDLRQPPRRARRRRPARRRLEARGRAPAPVPRRAPGRRPRRRADRPRPRPDRPSPREVERPRRPHPHPAGARRGRDRLGLARVRPRRREPHGPRASPPTATTPRAPSARPICALQNSNGTLSFLRAYTPELVGWFDDFGHSGYIDAIGGIGRIEATFNPFSLSLPGGLPNILDNPLTGDEILGSLDLGNNQKCPNANERPIEGRWRTVHRRRRPDRRQPGQRRVRPEPGAARTMRRIAAILAVLAAGAAGVASTAGADDTHTYEIEMYNAFGLVQGSDVRVAGVNAGSVSDLDISADKTAIVTVELTGELGTLGEDSKCTSEPQSLIAEYFISCEPAGPPIEEDDDTDDPQPDIPATQVSQTVQQDLVQNTLREPFKQRLQLLINEFGTALAGNPERLNAAIRAGAPALTQLRKVTKLLASQNTIIRDLQGELRRGDQHADRAPRGRRPLHPGGARHRRGVGGPPRRARPRLRDPRRLPRRHSPDPGRARDRRPRAAAAARRPARRRSRASTRWSTTCPASAARARTRSTASARRRRSARRRCGAAPTRSSSSPTPARRRPYVAEALADFFVRPRRPAPRGRDRPARRARHRPHEPERRQEDTEGYTGLEGLLNYAYYQPGALNQYDQIGHSLHFTLYNVFTGQCGALLERPRRGDRRAGPAGAGGRRPDDDEPARGGALRRRPRAEPARASTRTSACRPTTRRSARPGPPRPPPRDALRPERHQGVAGPVGQLLREHRPRRERRPSRDPRPAATAPRRPTGRRRARAAGDPGRARRPAARRTSSTRSSTCRRRRSTTCPRTSRTSSTT